MPASGKALMVIDKLTHAVPQGERTRPFLGAYTWACRTR